MKSDSATNIKNNFGSYLDRVKRGEVVLVLEYGKPVAQITKPILENEEVSLTSLEREGLVSLPQRAGADFTTFLTRRVKLTNGGSLVAALKREREESL